MPPRSSTPSHSERAKSVLGLHKTACACLRCSFRCVCVCVCVCKCKVSVCARAKSPGACVPGGRCSSRGRPPSPLPLHIAAVPTLAAGTAVPPRRC
eukprot:61060-Rhodomonas_salina.1